MSTYKNRYRIPTLTLGHGFLCAMTLGVGCDVEFIPLARPSPAWELRRDNLRIASDLWAAFVKARPQLPAAIEA